MSDLISRRAAIDALNKEYHGMLSDESMKIYQIKNWLSALPPTDAVEVVRCKDCKRYESDGGALMTCTLTDFIVDEDCYCWWGERREP